VAKTIDIYIKFLHDVKKQPARSYQNWPTVYEVIQKIKLACIFLYIMYMYFLIVSVAECCSLFVIVGLRNRM